MFEYKVEVTSCGGCPDYSPSEKNIGYFICLITGEYIDDDSIIDSTCPFNEKDIEKER